jgi:hypothetical protein
MKWFKHDTDATTDARVKKLILKYGAEGYAVYFHCIELIAGDTSETNITFELEHDAEIIADNLKIKGTSEESGIDRVNSIMRYIVSLGLFTEENGHVRCFKIAKRLDSSMTSSNKFRELINLAKSHDSVMISHDSVMQEETRVEEKKVNNTISNIPAVVPTTSPTSQKPSKHKFGEYSNVLLTTEEHLKLSLDPHGLEAIEHLSNYREMKGYKAKSDYLAIKNWVFNALKEKRRKEGVEKPEDDDLMQRAMKMAEESTKRLEEIRRKRGEIL